MLNLVEVRSDGFKLARVCMRPRSRRKGSIGTWVNIMVGIVALSALTNVYIFGFSSKQLMQCVVEHGGPVVSVSGAGHDDRAASSLSMSLTAGCTHAFAASPRPCASSSSSSSPYSSWVCGCGVCVCVCVLWRGVAWCGVASRFIPSWYVLEADGDQALAQGSGRHVVMLVFVVEHAILLLGLLIVAAVPAVPEDVQEQIERRAFVLARDARVQRLNRSKWQLVAAATGEASAGDDSRSSSSGGGGSGGGGSGGSGSGGGGSGGGGSGGGGGDISARLRKNKNKSFKRG
jgi:hypothetical protein